MARNLTQLAGSFFLSLSLSLSLMRFLSLYLLAEMGFDLLYRFSDLEIWVSFDLCLVLFVFVFLFTVLFQFYCAITYICSK